MKPHRRIGLDSTTIAVVLSPAMAFAISIVGYYSLAGIANIFLPQSNLGGILIRALMGGIVLASWLICFKYRDRVAPVVLYPGAIFLSFYFFRMCDVALFSDLKLPPSNEYAFLMFFLAGALASACLTSVVWRIDDHQLDTAMILLIGLFSLSVGLNWQDIVASSESRLLLDKINPISFAITAFSFVLYHLLSFGRSRRLMLLSLIVVPLLLLIIVYARSRGVYIAGAATLLLYALCLKGTRRLGFVLGLGSLGAALALWIAPEKFAIIGESLQRIFSGDDLSTIARRDAYSGGWGQFLEDPIFGRHIIELTTNYYSHNLYLESLMAVGIVGTVFLLVHVLLAFRAVFGIIRSSGFPFAARFASALFIFHSIIAASSGAVYLASEFWITSFMVIAFWYGQPHTRRTRPQLARNFLKAGTERATK